MSNEKKDRYTLLLANEYQVINSETGSKEVKTEWSRVSVAFPNDTGKSFNLHITPGMSVFGKVIMRLYEPRDDQEQEK